MLLHRKNHQRLDLTNRIRATRSLDALGFACTNASPGWYYDGSVYRQAAANAYRFCAAGGKTGLLIEETDTNEVLYSSENNAVWTVTNATKSATGNSIINGKTPIKVTATAAGGYIEQSVATLGGSDEYHYIIVEVGDGTVADLECSGLSRIRLTFATGAVTQVSGSSNYKGAYRISSSGPNGGAVWVLYQSATTVATPTVLRYYPDAAAGTKFGYLHHCQGSFNDIHGTSPIVTTTLPVQRGSDVITSSTVPSWWRDTQTTVLVSYERMFASVEQGCIFASSDGSPNNYMSCYLDAVYPNVAGITVAVGGVGYSVSSAQTLNEGTVNKVGFSQKNGSTYAAGGGTASANGSQVDYPTVISRFDIGQALGAVQWLNGRIFSMTIRPVALSSTELAANT